MKMKNILYCTLLIISMSLSLSFSSNKQTVENTPSLYLAFTFIQEKMMNSAGGIYTRYQSNLNQDTGENTSHDILLQSCGLLMLYAAKDGDRQIFDRQVKLIKEYFLVKDLGLLHWKLNTHMKPSVSSWKTYSNDLE
ncbi:MAG: hypothetical protein ACOC6H_04945, partial [Thermoproteota archaeon]